jgi:drug/metabolite transporter (DMT)-like permease
VRWTLLAVFGAALAAVGVVVVSLELAHGENIWRRGPGIGLIVGGGVCVWMALSQRESGTPTRDPIWPGLLSFGVLAAIAVALYLFAPRPLAILFLIIVLPFGWLSWGSWARE